LREGAALSEHWLDYSTFDVVVASWDELDALMHNRPQAWQALRRWVSAGGNLVVYKASDAWEWLMPLEADLPAPGVPRTEPPSDGSALPGTAPPSQAWDGTSSNMFLPAAFQMLRTWAKRSGTSAAQTRRGWSVARTLPPGQTTTMAAFRVLSAQVAPAVPPPAAESLIRPWNLGQVIALRADPLTPDPAIWLSVWSQLGDDRIAAAPRLGLSALSPNPDFWNLLVPNVGLPPVDAFRVLITLFVLVIGPVNYFLLRRLQRLHLLVFIVPAAALLVTLSLLGYAILGDGLGVKIRPRTLTVLDPARGEGVCWQRLSYYAGLAPSGGLSFSPETAVYPLMAQPSPYGRGEATRVVVWGENQNLTRGWLASRTRRGQTLADHGTGSPGDTCRIDRRRVGYAAKSGVFRVRQPLARSAPRNEPSGTGARTTERFRQAGPIAAWPAQFRRARAPLPAGRVWL
jgi:hypothetical protein